MVGRSDISLADLLRLGLLRPGQDLRMGRRTGAPIHATVTGQGTILLGGTEFRSPSLAANAIRGTNSNGWKTWQADLDGNMVYLEVLRQRARRVR